MNTVRLVTFNICSGKPGGPQGTPDQALLLAAITSLNADVLALQEVDRGQQRSGGHDQTAEAAAAMNCDPGNWRFAPALNGTPGQAWTKLAKDDGGTAYGIALLSRLPVTEWFEIELARAPVKLPILIRDPARKRKVLFVKDEPRVALGAVIETANGPMTVVCTHLTFLPGWNVRQLRQIKKQLRHRPRPLVLVGDLNLPGRVPALITGWKPWATALTFPADSPRSQLDHVLADGLPPREAGADKGQAVAPGVSDHRALVVELPG